MPGSPTMSTFARRLALWRLLDSCPVPMGLKALSDRFEVSKHTIQRDVDALSSAGIPVVEARRGQTALFSILKPPARIAPVELAQFTRRTQYEPN